MRIGILGSGLMGRHARYNLRASWTWSRVQLRAEQRQIGRAYAMQANATKARAAYQDFLTLWKDADPDVPVLKQAQAEYAKLQ